MASKYSEAFEAKLNEKNLKFTRNDRDDCVVFTIIMTDENKVDIQTQIIVNDNDLVSFRSYFAKLSDASKKADILNVINEKQNELIMVKFVLDEDNDISGQYDLEVFGDAETSAEQIFVMYVRFYSIVSDCYKDFMKAIWA